MVLAVSPEGGRIKPRRSVVARDGASKGRWNDALYKPYAIFDGKRWLLWYNGRRGGVEQIGLALHDGEKLGF
jgi:beta-1,2-mannobiose phosphorylase / 1,2-beta-oligomannan phosphorylase